MATPAAAPSAAFAVRTATRADLPALRALIDLSVRGLGAPFYTPAQIEASLRHVFGPDTHLVDDGTYLVAVGEGDAAELAGAGGWGRRRALYGGDQARAADDPLLDPSRDAARLRAFYVHPRWARRGIARAIAESCLAAMRAEGFRTVELLATLPGVPLYRALGFVEVEPYAVPMPGGLTLPCIVMRRAV
jgi:GNAT superfamily N-acetyltransferase